MLNAESVKQSRETVPGSCSAELSSLFGIDNSTNARPAPLTLHHVPSMDRYLSGFALDGFFSSSCTHSSLIWKVGSG
jgi:hypothetical protein